MLCTATTPDLTQTSLATLRRSRDRHLRSWSEWGMHAHTAGAAAVCLQRWLLELHGRLGIGGRRPRGHAHWRSSRTAASPAGRRAFPPIREALTIAITARLAVALLVRSQAC